MENEKDRYEKLKAIVKEQEETARREIMERRDKVRDVCLRSLAATCTAEKE